jgi:hypothetical protein
MKVTSEIRSPTWVKARHANPAPLGRQRKRAAGSLSPYSKRLRPDEGPSVSTDRRTVGRRADCPTAARLRGTRAPDRADRAPGPGVRMQHRTHRLHRGAPRAAARSHRHCRTLQHATARSARTTMKFGRRHFVTASAIGSGRDDRQAAIDRRGRRRVSIELAQGSTGWKGRFLRRVDSITWYYELRGSCCAF